MVYFIFQEVTRNYLESDIESDDFINVLANKIMDLIETENSSEQITVEVIEFINSNKNL